MSSSVPASAIPWTTSAVDSTAPVTTDTLIRGWLNENGFDDLTDLSLTDLQALIAFLSQHTGVAGVSALLNQLKQLEAGWRASGNGEDKLSNQIDSLKFQIKFLDILAKNTTGMDALDEAKQASAGNLQKLEDAKKAILEGSLPWEEDNGAASRESAASLLAKLEELKALGFDLEALGLQDLYNGLTAAISAYDSAVAAAGGDATKVQLAGSQLRKTMAGEFKNYYLNSGYSDLHGLVMREQDIIEGENTYQDYLAVPMDENWRPNSVGASREDIQKSYDEAYRMYKDAEARGDVDAMNYFRERMTILRTAGEQLDAGETNPLIVIIEMYTSLLNLDSVRLTDLRQEALDAGNQELADKIKTRIDEIGQLIQEIVKGEVKLLENEQNLMASIPTR